MNKKQHTSEEIVGNLDPKHWVQKSDPLMLMRTVPFSLGELKILDTYISRINAADNTRRTVIFTKEEYEELMGLTDANYRALEKHTEGLLGKIVTLEMPDKAFLKFVLFTKAYYHKDEYGKPIIEITCTEEAKELFFCIENYQYFKYTLENVISLTRKASYLLYLHIIHERYRKEWTVSVDELRDNILGCKGQDSYKEYKIFKRDVFDPAVKEVNLKTDCHFEYEQIKRGRWVTEIKFIYLSKNQLDGQTALMLEDSSAASSESQQLTAPEELSDELKEIYNILHGIITDTEQLTSIQLALTAKYPDSSEMQLKTLRECYARYFRYSSKVKNPYKYILKIIDKQETRKPQGNQKKPKSSSSFDLDLIMEHAKNIPTHPVPVDNQSSK